MATGKARAIARKENMSKYSKAIAAFFGSLSTWGLAASATGGISAAECWGLLGVLAATFATYQVTNVVR